MVTDTLPPRRRPSALDCDEYELTMAQSFWRHEQDRDVVAFEVFVRTLPSNRGYLLVAGLEQVLDYLHHFAFLSAEIDALRAQGSLDAAFIDHLAEVRFTGDVNAIAEGTVAGAAMPLLQVAAPRLEATLIESALLSMINHQTLIASKAARIVLAAQGKPVWDFSLRRLHGVEASFGVARAAYIAGCAGTATVNAGLELGIPTTGTMAHHYVQAFGEDREQAAFEQFLRDFPSRAVLLVDTYDTPRGVDRAAAASHATGVPLGGVRIDSGDLAELSRDARRRLDAAGFSGAIIVASNDLDEFRIAELLAEGAPIDLFGVGTMLGTSADAPALGGVYKLVAQTVGGVVQMVMKRSAAKMTDPGLHQVWRTDSGDVVGLASESDQPGIPLLDAVMRRGESLHAAPSLDSIRVRAREQLAGLTPAVARLIAPAPWPVRRSEELTAVQQEMIRGTAGGS